jgi:hypothetical protein
MLFVLYELNFSMIYHESNHFECLGKVPLILSHINLKMESFCSIQRDRRSSKKEKPVIKSSMVTENLSVYSLTIINALVTESVYIRAKYSFAYFCYIYDFCILVLAVRQGSYLAARYRLNATVFSHAPNPGTDRESWARCMPNCIGYANIRRIILLHSTLVVSCRKLLLSRFIKVLSHYIE